MHAHNWLRSKICCNCSACVWSAVLCHVINVRCDCRSVKVSKDTKKTNREKDDSRLTKLMLSIFIFFLLCFLPLMLVNVFDDDVRYPVFHVLGSILAWASSVINPFIYVASNRQYRTAYSTLFRAVRSSMAFSDSRNNSLRNTVDQKSGHLSNVKSVSNCEPTWK